jgi:hypothetical protein
MSPGKLRGEGVFMLRRKSSGKSVGDSGRSSMHVTPEKDVKVNGEWPTVCSVGGCGNARLYKMPAGKGSDQRFVACGLGCFKQLKGTKQR